MVNRHDEVVFAVRATALDFGNFGWHGLRRGGISRKECGCNGPNGAFHRLILLMNECLCTRLRDHTQKILIVRVQIVSGSLSRGMFAVKSADSQHV